MTFRGNLLLYSLWYELHPFENLRRKGHHCHGLTHLSWAERKIFYRFLGKKFCGLFIYPWTVSAAGCGCLCPPATGTHTGVWHPAGNEQGPAATTESACAKRRCPLHIPAAFCRDAGSAGHGATEAARPERSLQAGVFTHRTVAAARNRASGFGGDWQVRQQLPVGVGPDDRMPPGSREPKVRPADRTTLQ